MHDDQPTLGHIKSGEVRRARVHPDGSAEPLRVSRLLLFGEDRDRCEGLASILRVLGFDVSSAYTNQAVEDSLLESNNDVVIIDCDSDAASLEALKKIWDADPEVRTLMISEKASRDQALESFGLGADALIWRPTEPDVLEEQITDLVETRSGGAEIRIAENRLLQLLDEMGDGVFECDTEGNLTSINQVGARALGYETIKEALNGRLKLWEPRLSEDKEKPKRSLMHLRSRNGDIRWVEVVVHTKKNRRGEALGFEGLFRDVTKAIRRLVILEAIQDLSNDLETASSLEEVGELAMGFLKVMLGMDGGYIALTDGEALSLVAGIGEGVDLDSNFEDSEIATKAVLTGEPQISDYLEDIWPPTPGELFTHMSEMTIPVKIDGQVVALIYMNSSTPCAYSEEKRMIACMIADKVSSRLHSLMRAWLDIGSDIRLREFK